MRTSGDRLTEGPLTEVGGKGLFTKEIDEALMDSRVDIGVHSAKDMATALPEGMVIAACLPRADVRDAFISPVAKTLADLPQGARLGTSSLRRRAMALSQRPDLQPVNLRGNVQTRLQRIEDGLAHATLLAAAGLARLGLSHHAASFIEPDEWLPAPGQGIVAIAARADDAETLSRLAAINNAEAFTALAAERAFLTALDGSCRTPIGALARIEGGQIRFSGVIVRPDGSEAHRVSREGAVADAAALGRDAGLELLKRGGADFFTGQ